jgi:hypothetical protein
VSVLCTGLVVFGWFPYICLLPAVADCERTGRRGAWHSIFAPAWFHVSQVPVRTNILLSTFSKTIYSRLLSEWGLCDSVLLCCMLCGSCVHLSPGALCLFPAALLLTAMVVLVGGPLVSKLAFWNEVQLTVANMSQGTLASESWHSDAPC